MCPQLVSGKSVDIGRSEESGLIVSQLQMTMLIQCSYSAPGMRYGLSAQ